MNYAKRVLLGSILLWAILLSACSPSTISTSTLNAIYTFAAQTVEAQNATDEQTAMPIPTETISILTPTIARFPLRRFAHDCIFLANLHYLRFQRHQL